MRWLLPFLLAPLLAGCLSEDVATDQGSAVDPVLEEPTPAPRTVVQEDYDSPGRFERKWCLVAVCLSQGEPESPEPIEVTGGRVLTGVDLELTWDLDEAFGTVSWILSCRTPRGSCDPGRIGQAEGASPLHVAVDGLQILPGALVEMEVAVEYSTPAGWGGAMASGETYRVQGTVSFLE